MAQAMTRMMEARARDDHYEKSKSHDPPAFLGDLDPMAVERWLQHMERIFRVMRCTDPQKMDLATYKLHGESEHWWHEYRQEMEESEMPVTWELFQGAFLENYFPSNLKDKKEIEFLELKQGEMTIGQYVAKFEELARYSNNLRNQPDDAWKSKSFEQGLRPEIRNQVVTQEI
jgi:hypothetical protein